MTKKPAASKSDPGTNQSEVKVEATAVTLDKLPLTGAGTDASESRQIADLKHEDVKPRASTSSGRPSPPPTTAPTPTSKDKKDDTKKKGATKKVPASNSKKRKPADEENVQATLSRSNTPQSSRASKTPAPKKQKMTTKNTPASAKPETRGRKKGGKNKTSKNNNKGDEQKQQEGQEEDGEDSASDPDQVFCICRKPDNHTWMIGCDGDCEDWFHGKCVHIDSKNAELIDRYICKLFQTASTPEGRLRLTTRIQAPTVANEAMVALLGNQCVGYLGVASRLVSIGRIRVNTAPMTTGENSCVKRRSSSA